MIRLTTTYFILLIGCILPLTLASGLFEPSLSSPVAHRSFPVKRATTGYICENVAVHVPLNQSVCTTVPGTTTGGVTTCVTPGVPATCTTTPVVTTPAVTTCVLQTLDVIVTNSICLCLSAGALTPDSATRLNATVQGNGPIFSQLTTSQNGTIGYTADQLLNYVSSNERSILNTDSATGPCTYPTGSTPNSCSGDCVYTCPAGQSNCNGQCARTCVSGIPGQRRSLGDSPESGKSDLRCPTGLSACGLPTTKLNPRTSGAFECINTQTDIESCGGCSFPLSTSSGQKGRDCTSIPHASGVGCNNGQCVVLNCDRGFSVDLDGKSCVPKAGVLEGVSEQTVLARGSRKDAKRTREALKSRQVRASVLRSGQVRASVLRSGK